ncbi:MAG: hypothetical protein IT368_00765 [Candidatus Hydrogenedentes bacterium]|nr:hypothetical protein [Candidatus Hydrogenedentota bacterium]
MLLRLLILGIALAGAVAAQPGWAPVPDSPFLQEIGSQIKTSEPVLAVAVCKGIAYAALPDGIYASGSGIDLTLMPASPPRANRLYAAGNSLYALAPGGVYHYADAWRLIAPGDFVDMCDHGGRLIVASRDNLYAIEEGSLAPASGAAAPPMPIAAITSYAETIYCMSPTRIMLFNGTWQHEDLIDWGSFTSKDLRDVQGFGNRLLIANHFGLCELRGTIARQIVGGDGLPVNECHHLAPGFANDFWIGTPQGAIRVVNGEYQYFQGPRWLPNDEVNDIAAGDNVVYIATNAGVGVIRYEPFTLQKKAAYYEKHLDAWGQKRMAFTHKLEWDGAANAWMREVSDNDVGWSTHWWAAMTFKYAVTGDPVARQHAIDGFNAMKWSEEITPIDGFPARAIWAVGETGHQAQGGSGGYAAEWHRTPDDLWEWKGDTSSDEIDAHFYYASIFHDLVADDGLKAQVRDHIARLASHIIDNGWVLRDFDGAPTVWGRWDLEYLDGFRGRFAWGLNGMEALNYMRTAYALTEDPKFLDACNHLLENNYTRQVIRQKHVSPRPLVFHSDDRLAFYTYYTLLRYEDQPELRSIYRRSLDRSWEVERIERNPWFNFIYCALTGNAAELGEAADHLRAWPLDLVEYAFDHSGRDDYSPPAGYVPYTNEGNPISPRERGGYRWSVNPFETASNSGHTVLDPSGWLDAYWMGRYYGFILPPDTRDPALLDPPPVPPGGAAPYDGPPMPKVLD